MCFDRNRRHHEAGLEKWCRMQWSKVIFEPRRPVSWTFLHFWLRVDFVPINRSTHLKMKSDIIQVILHDFSGYGPMVTSISVKTMFLLTISECFAIPGDIKMEPTKMFHLTKKKNGLIFCLIYSVNRPSRLRPILAAPPTHPPAGQNRTEADGGPKLWAESARGPIC